MNVRNFELYFKGIMRGHRKGILPSLIKMGLLPLSWLYRAGVNCRNYLYERGLVRSYTPPVPLVISVGNIVAGGTGKTPTTLLLAGAFYDRFTIAILCRGYRSKAEKLENPLLLCEGNGPFYPASYCGDEPLLFAQRLPKSIVIVGGNRRKASFLAAKAGAQIILLDDGMQHRQLVRDFDIVVIDVTDPFGQGYFLPRGFLREDVRSLARAHLIILNHIKDLDQFMAVKFLLKPYSKAPMVGTQKCVVAIRDLNGNQISMPDERTVGMFCAIAQPDHFRETLEKEGFHVVSEYILPDHDNIRESDLEEFAVKSLKMGAKWLICTEKDRVKLQDDFTFSLPVIWIQLQLQIVAGEEEWNKFLKEAESKIK